MKTNMNKFKVIAAVVASFGFMHPAFATDFTQACDGANGLTAAQGIGSARLHSSPLDINLNLSADRIIKVTGTIPKACSEGASIEYKYDEATIAGPHVITIHLNKICEQNISSLTQAQINDRVPLSSITGMGAALEDRDGKITLRSVNGCKDPAGKGVNSDEVLNLDAVVSSATQQARADANKAAALKTATNQAATACRNGDVATITNLMQQPGMEELATYLAPAQKNSEAKDREAQLTNIDKAFSEALSAEDPVQAAKDALAAYIAYATEKGLDIHAKDQMYLTTRLKITEKAINAAKADLIADAADAEDDSAADDSSEKRSLFKHSRTRRVGAPDAVFNAKADAALASLNQLKTDLEANAEGIDKDLVHNTLSKGKNSLDVAHLFLRMADRELDAATKLGGDNKHPDRANAAIKVAQQMLPANGQELTEARIQLYAEAVEGCKDIDDLAKRITCSDRYRKKDESIARPYGNKLMNYARKHPKDADAQSDASSFASTYAQLFGTGPVYATPYGMMNPAGTPGLFQQANMTAIQQYQQAQMQQMQALQQQQQAAYMGQMYNPMAGGMTQQTNLLGGGAGFSPVVNNSGTGF